MTCKDAQRPARTRDDLPWDAYWNDGVAGTWFKVC